MAELTYRSACLVGAIRHVRAAREALAKAAAIGPRNRRARMYCHKAALAEFLCAIDCREAARGNHPPCRVI